MKATKKLTRVIIAAVIISAALFAVSLLFGFSSPKKVTAPAVSVKPTASAGAACNHEWSHSTALTSAGELAADTKYYLEGDIKLTTDITVPSGTVDICLNGHKLEGTGTGSVITINSGSTLNLYDCGGGVITGGNAQNGGGVYVNGGTFNMNGGAISGNTAESGGGVSVHGGEFTMKGSAVIGGDSEQDGNKAEDFGGGVDVNPGGTFTMEDGAIKYNTASYGGGVYVQGAFTMKNGAITHNSASGDCGGVSVDGVFTMEGGTISHNTASRACGVYVNTDGKFNVHGSVIITDNTSSNVYLQTHVINIDGELENDARIGVTLASGTGTFTSGLSDHGSIDNFISDNKAYVVAISDKEAILAVPVAEVNGNKYAFVGDALTAAAGTKFSVKLLSDCSLTPAQSYNGDIALDLNGKTLTLAAHWTWSDNYTLTIDDSSQESNGTIHTNAGSGFMLSGGQLRLKKGTVSGTSDDIAVQLSGGDFTMLGGAVKDCGTGVYITSGSTFTITGGTVTGCETGVRLEGGVLQTGGGASAVVIDGNGGNDGVKNIEILNNCFISVSGDFAKGSKIGITAQVGTDFTKGWSGSYDSSVFFSDASSEQKSFIVVVNSKTKQLAIAAETEYLAAVSALEELRAEVEKGLANLIENGVTNLQSLLSSAQSAVEAFVTADGKTDFLSDYAAIADAETLLDRYQDYLDAKQHANEKLSELRDEVEKDFANLIENGEATLKEKQKTAQDAVNAFLAFDGADTSSLTDYAAIADAKALVDMYQDYLDAKKNANEALDELRTEIKKGLGNLVKNGEAILKDKKKAAQDAVNAFLEFDGTDTSSLTDYAAIADVQGLLDDYAVYAALCEKHNDFLGKTLAQIDDTDKVKASAFLDELDEIDAALRDCLSADIVAKIERAKNTYKVTLDAADGSDDADRIKTVLVVNGNTVALPTPIPPDGFEFGGWYTESGESFTAKTWALTQNITLVAHYNQKAASGGDTTGDKGPNPVWITLIAIAAAVVIIELAYLIIQHAKKKRKTYAVAPLPLLALSVADKACVTVFVVLVAIALGLGVLILFTRKRPYAKKSEDVSSSPSAAEKEQATTQEKETSAEKEQAPVAQAAEQPEPEKDVPEKAVEPERKEIEPVEPEKEDVEEVVTEVKRITENGKTRLVVIRYIKSFTAKLIQSEEQTKDYYSEIKNYLLSYSGVTSKISWKHEAFRKGKTLLCKLRLRGKTLSLCLALNADDYADTKYHVENVSEIKSLAQTPCLYKIKNDRRLAYSKDLIDALMTGNGVDKNEAAQKIDYALKYPFEPNEPLIERKLIKVMSDKEAQSSTAFKGELMQSVAAQEVDALMQDEVATTLIVKSDEISDKTKSGIVNIDTLSKCFESGDTVTLDEIKKRIKGFNKKVTYLKVLARGTLDKPLTIEADSFSIQAVKMIVLTGGTAIKKQ
ncbi:MAG: uL15 family ribosomal protein [Clostridiales bacterium]|nr:uL15 family ribosomal protein [Clostridiales bacterium]